MKIYLVQYVCGELFDPHAFTEIIVTNDFEKWKSRMEYNGKRFCYADELTLEKAYSYRKRCDVEIEYVDDGLPEMEDDVKTKRIAENVHELTLIANEMKGDIDCDSREIFQEVYKLAVEFERIYADAERNGEVDYLTEIIEFGEKKLSEYFEDLRR